MVTPNLRFNPHCNTPLQRTCKLSIAAICIGGEDHPSRSAAGPVLRQRLQPVTAGVAFSGPADRAVIVDLPPVHQVGAGRPR